MREEEKIMVQNRVKTKLIPSIKRVIPGFLGWILKKIFPRLEQIIIIEILEILDLLLDIRETTIKKD